MGIAILLLHIGTVVASRIVLKSFSGPCQALTVAEKRLICDYHNLSLSSEGFQVDLFWVCYLSLFFVYNQDQKNTKKCSQE